MEDDEKNETSNARKSKAAKKKPHQYKALKNLPNPDGHQNQPRRPLLMVQSSLAKIPESNYRPSKPLEELEKGYTLRAKGHQSKEVFCVVDQFSPVAYVAVKGQAVTKSPATHYIRIESMDNTNSPSKLGREVIILQEAATKAMADNRKHFLNIVGRGRIVEKSFNYIILPLCERSLLLSGGRQYTQSDALRLSVQCFQAIHDLHALGFVHRNLNPSVFCLRTMDNGEVGMFLTSFWYSYRFQKRDGVESRSPKTLCKMKKSKFMPRSYHLCKEITRKDDLESWIYTTVHLIEPTSLSWNNTMPDLHVLSMKERFFCVDSDVEPFDSLPRDIHAIVKYLHKLDGSPNYPFLGMLLAEMIKKERVPIDGPFDFQSNKYAEPKALQQVTKKKSKSLHPKHGRTKEYPPLAPTNIPKTFISSNQLEDNEEPVDAAPPLKSSTDPKKRQTSRAKKRMPQAQNEEDPFEGEDAGGEQEDVQAPFQLRKPLPSAANLKPVMMQTKAKKKSTNRKRRTSRTRTQSIHQPVVEPQLKEAPTSPPPPPSSTPPIDRPPKTAAAAPPPPLAPAETQDPEEGEDEKPEEKATQKRTAVPGELNDKSGSDQKETKSPPTVFTANKVPKPKAEDPKEEL